MDESDDDPGDLRSRPTMSPFPPQTDVSGVSWLADGPGGVHPVVGFAPSRAGVLLSPVAEDLGLARLSDTAVSWLPSVGLLRTREGFELRAFGQLLWSVDRVIPNRGGGRVADPPATLLMIDLPGGFGAGEFPRLPPSLIWAGRVRVWGADDADGGTALRVVVGAGGSDHDRRPSDTTIRSSRPGDADRSPDSTARTRAPFVVYAGRPWPSDENCPADRLVAHFESLDDAQQAFSHVTFRALPTLDGRARWRGPAPFGADIVQIEHRINTRVDSSRRD